MKIDKELIIITIIAIFALVFLAWANENLFYN